MSFRGRGRGGRGRGGGFGGFDHAAKHVPHEDFPASKEEKALIVSTLKLEEFWRTSCYHLEEDALKKKNEDKQIERFSDRKRKTQAKREALASYLKLSSSNFPAELVQGSRRGQVSNKKLRWDKDSDENAFEVFEKLEEKHKDGSKVEKEGDEEDEQEEEEAQEEEENSDDDYNQNIEFDDDDDDWNQAEEAHEDYYD
uniref:DNA-directed RNA polymerase III subunit n=1 Tax=Setaria italica TaxID=4555 RepID=K3ZX36_SETIT